MATIRKRGDKWQVQVRRSGYQPLSRTFRKKTDANEWARHIEAEADRQGMPPNLKQHKCITVKALIQRYMDTVTVRKRGKEQEAGRLGLMRKHRLANSTLADLTPGIFSKYRDERLNTIEH